ncbi:hypothetical protein ACQEV9_46145 [Streptomyces chartreusis]|uniref:hypothetical protein n=1 Tax=Streptomyces chartreusis TaxID=1969 RepID=UPI003D8BF35C
MAMHFTVTGTLELHPPVPLAQLWELIDGGPFQVAPHAITKPELAALLDQAKWVLVPDIDSGTDSEGRPQRIKHLHVKDPSVYSFTVLHRLIDLVTCTGEAHQARGELRYAGDCEGEVGTITPGPDPIWH